MLQKFRPLRENTGSIFNRSFFGFLSGFLSLVFFGLVSVFIAGYYKTESIGKREGLKAKAPIQQVKSETTENTSVVLKSLGEASSTKKSNR